MNWDDLKLVDAAARFRSLSLAARSLELSQPQLSRRLRQFEDQIGARLFERTPTGLKPTEAGKKLIPLAHDMREAADAASRSLPDLSSSRLRVVRIAVDEVRARILTGRFEDMCHLLGDIEVEVISSHSHADHQNRATELQVRTCMPDTETLIARKLGHVAYAVYAAPGYISANPHALGTERYSRCRWVGFVPDRLWHPQLAKWLDDRMAARTPVRTNKLTIALELAASGAGLALLPVFLAETDQRLVRLTDPIAELTGTDNLIVHRDLKREPAVRHVMDAIIGIYKKAAPELTGAAFNPETV